MNMIYRLFLIVAFCLYPTQASDEALDERLSPQGKITMEHETTCHPLRCLLVLPGGLLGGAGGVIGLGVGAFLVGPYTLCTQGYYLKAIMDCTLGGAHIGWQLGHGRCG